jgi:hypothetical protein
MREPIALSPLKMREKNMSQESGIEMSAGGDQDGVRDALWCELRKATEFRLVQRTDPSRTVVEIRIVDLHTSIDDAEARTISGIVCAFAPPSVFGAAGVSEDGGISSNDGGGQALEPLVAPEDVIGRGAPVSFSSTVGGFTCVSTVPRMSTREFVLDGMIVLTGPGRQEVKGYPWVLRVTCPGSTLEEIMIPHTRL